ncbi:THUMP domain-containing protein 1-like [Penaeus indicus]|uniref:THUMP domain-containing protein 1-like n=1 Tax=Penaeus indicus TaxID=29960 RepID=UPI00300C5B90
MGKNKRRKSYYIQSAKRQKRKDSCLGPDMMGFLCMCNGHERECVQESYNILNEFANELYGKEEWQAQNTPKEASSDNKDSNKVEQEKSADTKEKDSESEEEDLDIDAAIKADVSELQKEGDKKERCRRRFQQVECAAKNCIFISTTLENPLELSMKIMDSILETQKQRTKKLLRMIPVQKTCKAFQKDIEGALETLAKAYFEKESKTYCIVSKIRNNSLIKREDLTQSLISVLQGANSDNAPDLKTPDVVVNVDVIKNVCCLSILPGYFTPYCKYNLVGIANKHKEPEKEQGKNGTDKAKESEPKDAVGSEEVVNDETSKSKSQESSEKDAKPEDDEVKEA